jgi:hypothetical protein
MPKRITRIKRIYSSEGTPLEKKYFLSQAMTTFSGALVFAPIVIQNIKEAGFNPFNIISFISAAFLLIIALGFWLASITKWYWINCFAKMTLRGWTGIPILFFYFSLIMGVIKLITSYMVDWQVWVFFGIGTILLFTSVAFWFSSFDIKNHSK